jgi:beta-galactosidase
LYARCIQRRLFKTLSVRGRCDERKDKTMKHLKQSLTAICCCFILNSITCAGAAAAVKIEHSDENGYRLMVDGKPFLIRGVCYSPVPPGEDHNYNFWKDLDTIEQDAALMKDAGINVVRFYGTGDSVEETRKVIRLLYDKYGIYSIVGHWLGFWNYPYPFYADLSFREGVKKEVLEMVKAYKDEPGVLMWGLGNENNFSFAGKVNPWTSPELSAIEDPSQKITKKAEIYYGMVNDIALAIKEIDPTRPVAMGNGETNALDIAARTAPDIDILALIFYRGKHFGNLFEHTRTIFDKPIMLFEMGADAYDAYKNGEDEGVQAEFIAEQWKSIYKSSMASGNASGNCLGGVIFEWVDEWWKHEPDDPSLWEYHDTMGGWSNGAYYTDIKAARNLNMNEEWFGLLKYERQENGALKKKPRKVYYVLKDFFRDPDSFLTNKL